nr:hypothetical protein [Klebsiella quasipneumoniae]UWM21460.1 hypothetical protein [Escherichia coli]UWM22437.1 hypothetical protein [Escherichia coli]
MNKTKGCLIANFATVPFSHHARARDSCSRRLGAKLSGNIKARSLEPLPSRTMIVP